MCKQQIAKSMMTSLKNAATKVKGVEERSKLTITLGRLCSVFGSFCFLPPSFLSSFPSLLSFFLRDHLWTLRRGARDHQKRKRNADRPDGGSKHISMCVNCARGEKRRTSKLTRTPTLSIFLRCNVATE